MTPEDRKKNIEELKKVLAVFESKLQAPFSIDDLSQMDAYYNDLHPWYVTVSSYEPLAEVMFLELVSQAISSSSIPDLVWNRIKGSSTLQMKYFAGKFAPEYTIWKQLSNSLSSAKEILYNLRTQIATHRERSAIEGQRNPKQN